MTTTTSSKVHVSYTLIGISPRSSVTNDGKSHKAWYVEELIWIFNAEIDRENKNAVVRKHRAQPCGLHFVTYFLLYLKTDYSNCFFKYESNHRLA